MKTKFIVDYYLKIYKESRFWLNKALLIFGVSIGLGFVTFFIYPKLLETIIDVFASKFGATPELDANLAMSIFQQNAIATLAALFGGLIFGITSVLIVFVNGFLIGYVIISIFFFSEGNLAERFLVLAMGLIPHGILELPAFIIAAAMGLRLGLEWVSRDAKGKRWKVVRGNLIKALGLLPLILLILLIAGFVEVFVSGRLIS